jgi:hypothetical protein
VGRFYFASLVLSLIIFLKGSPLFDGLVAPFMVAHARGLIEQGESPRHVAKSLKVLRRTFLQGFSGFGFLPVG